MKITTEEIHNITIDDLTESEKSKLAKQITDNFATWDDDRSSQINTARKIMLETYLKQQPIKQPKGLEWKNDVKLNALYSIKKAKKSVIWREMWSNTAQMFDVRGTNEQTEQQAKMQKAAIVDSLEKMDVGKQYDEVIDDLYDIGEMIFKTDWEQKVKIVKRQQKGLGFVFQNIVQSMLGAGYNVSNPAMKDVELPYYENARVERISPFMFVFDHSKVILGDEDSWKKCVKIYKRFENLEDLKNNKLYKITPQMISELETQTENKTDENKELADLRDEDSYGGKYAVLYAHGDFKINGKMYRNCIAEVLGNYLIRFEENPFYINPFIFCALEFDPLTKRGISPLKSVYDMIMQEQKLTNIAFDIQELTANPPNWMNEDLIDENNCNKDGNVILAPGKQLKYKNDYAGGMPQPVTVSSGGISDLLGLLNQKISEVSNVSDVMYGTIEDAKRTATELSLADKGSSAQASKELDIINQDLTIPMIKNVAELLAMFKDGIDYVYAQEKGKNIEYKITNQIRQAQYNYIYEDRNAIADRKAKFKELYQLFNAIGQNQELFNMINWREVITTAAEMIGFDNTEKFFNPETPLNQLFTQIKTFPPAVQEQLVPIITLTIQNVMQNMQQQQQQAQAMQSMQQAQRQPQLPQMQGAPQQSANDWYEAR